MFKYYEEKETLLKVENLNFSIGSKNILKNINFEIKNVVKTDEKQGQVIAFLGRSGRGKSTLFRLLAGLEMPTSGKILIPFHTADVNSKSQEFKNVEEGNVGFVDQKYTLFRHKTVYQALMYASRKLKLSHNEKDIKITQYLNEWGLINCKNQYPNELSGGQRQRTAILEQLLCSTNFLILDEPFSGLDVGNVENVKSAIHLVNKSNDLSTIIFSTHDIELAVEIADTIYIIGYTDNNYCAEIIKLYDLKKLGICWADELTANHYEIMKEIRSVLLNS